MYGIGVREDRRDERVPRFVICGNLLLLLIEDVRAAFGTEHHFLYRADEVVLRYLRPVLACGENGRLVHQIGEVRAGKSGRALGDDGKLHIGAEGFQTRVYVENILAVFPVGQIDDDATVEASGAQKRRVEHIRPVGRGHDDDLLVGLEAVHLDEYLVERLFALVVAAADARAAHAPDRVYFVHENDGRCGFLRSLKKIAYARVSYADEHLDEFRAGDGEERHARLSRDGACK